MSAPNAPSAATRQYPLIGVVRETMKDSGQVMIRHDAIPGFMSAMTMPFHVDDHDLLEEIHAGDEVAGTLEVVTEAGDVRSYRLRDLRVTRPALAAPPPPSVTRLQPGEPVPDVVMTTQEGREQRLSDLRGRWVVLTFIYTRCPLPDFCPLMDRKFNELAGRLKLDPARADSVRLISLSFDPEYDTPEVLSRHARRNGATPPLWTFAVATHEALGPLAEGLGLTYAPGEREIAHNLVTAVIAPDGTLSRVQRGRDWQPAGLLRDLRAEARTEGPAS
jgi:protein SCO1/2